MENRLIQWIYDKPYTGFISKLKHKFQFISFLRSLKHISPDLNMLWTIADFLKLLKIVYFYNPSIKEDYISYYDTKIEDATGFVIVENNIEIKFILRMTHPNITIEIRDRNDYKTIMSRIKFDDGCAEIRNQTDGEIFNSLNNLIMDKVSLLLKEYYDKKH